MAEITDLSIKALVDAGRPWEAAAAGRMLPSLARLRWEGFEVSVVAVRGVDLDEMDEDEVEDERPFLRGPVKTALLSCIEGEGEPPLELLLAAVACAGSGEIRGIPVQMMREYNSVSEIDLQARDIGVEGGLLLAYLVPVGHLTALDLSFNDLKDEGVSAVCEAIQTNKDTKLASLNFENNGIGPVGANAVAAMVAVTGALTVANLLYNQLDAESAKMLAEVAKQKGVSLCGIQRDQTTADLSGHALQPPDAILLASDLSQAVVTGTLTVVR